MLAYVNIFAPSPSVYYIEDFTMMYQTTILLNVIIPLALPYSFPFPLYITIYTRLFFWSGYSLSIFYWDSDWYFSKAESYCQIIRRMSNPNSSVLQLFSYLHTLIVYISILLLIWIILISPYVNFKSIRSVLSLLHSTFCCFNCYIL